MQKHLQLQFGSVQHYHLHLIHDHAYQAHKPCNTKKVVKQSYQTFHHPSDGHEVKVMVYPYLIYSNKAERH